MSYKSNGKIRHPPNPVKSPFSSGEYSQQQPQQTTPETIMIECNRKNALYSGAGEVGLDSENNTWISEFSSGIQLRAGDEVKVHSAFLSSIGVGDLIAWNRDEGSTLQDNKGTWIYSFYGSNDAKNDKREQYNMTIGKGTFPYDVDNRPCPLYRMLPSVLSTNIPVGRPNSGGNFTYYQDPYCPARILGEKPIMKPNIIDSDLLLTFVNNIDDSGTPTGRSMMLLEQFTGVGNNKIEIDATKLFSIGSTYKFFPKVNAYDNTVFDITRQFIFTVFDMIDLTGNPQYQNYINGAEIENQQRNGGLEYTGNDTADSIAVVLSSGYFQEVIMSGNWNYGTGSANPDVPVETPLATSISDFNQISTVGNEVFLVHNPTIDATNPELNSVGSVIYENNELVLFNLVESPNENMVIDVEFLHMFNPADDTDHSYLQVKFKNTNLNSIADLLTLNNGFYMMGFYCNGLTNNNEFMTAYFWDSPTKTNITYDDVNTFTFTNVLRSVNVPDSVDNFNQNQLGNCLLYGQYNNGDFKYQHAGSEKQNISVSPNPVPLVALNRHDLYSMVNLDYLLDIFDSVEQIPNLLTWNRKAFDPTVSTRASSFTSFVGDSSTFYPTNTYSTVINGFQTITTDINEYKHYSTYTFKIDEDYSSPSDIATELTKQTHTPTQPRDNFGNHLPKSVIGDRLSTGIAQNEFLLPVWTSAINDAGQSNEESATGLTNVLATGSFIMKANIYNLPTSSMNISQPAIPATPIGDLTNGEYDIYFRTQHTTFNKPVFVGEVDFDQRDHPSYAVINGKTAGGTPEGYPIRYIAGQECYVSQYIGSDNISFNWDTTSSRFTFSYLHQPQVSTFSANAENGTESGGVESAIIYYPEPEGLNNFLYKVPQTRNGGVCVENWLSYDIPYGMTPKEIRTLTGVADDVDLSSEWFITKPTDGSTPSNKSSLSKRFWTKLGFDENQFNSVGFKREDVSNNYIPLSTTDGLIDVADGVISLEEPAEDTPWYYTNKEDPALGTIKNPPLTYDYDSSIGALNCTGHAKGYGLPNTAGKPSKFYTFFTPALTPQPTGAILPWEQRECSYNPDRERHRAFTVSSTSTEIVAKNLPTKTENGYFLIMSDIVDTEFYVSANKGTNLNCVGIISKLNAEGDFYYQYQAPQSFYVKKDKLIGSIMIDIRQPDLTTPNAISPYSSILFQITRFNPIPQSIPQPIWSQQQEFFTNLTNSFQQIIEQNKPVVKTPERTRLAEIMNQVSSAILQVKTEEGEPNLVQRIIDNYDRMNLSSFKDDPRGLRQFLLANPEASGFLDDLTNISAPAPIIPTDPEQLTEEGLFNYVSQYQPQVSGSGFAVDTPPFLPEADPTIDIKTPAEITQFIIDNQKARLLNDQKPLGADDIASMLGAGATPQRIESLVSLGQKMENNMIEAKSGENEARNMDAQERKEEIRQRQEDRYKEFREKGGKSQFKGEKKEDLALSDRLSRQAGRPPVDRPSFYIKPPDFNDDDDEDE